ncbi:MAG: DUF1559 domain-containing protein, partial [Thermoguttaceae bacterium]|nr:DUF1559 domain-containing protein [Thermoguttaceae bacterium]
GESAGSNVAYCQADVVARNYGSINTVETDAKIGVLAGSAGAMKSRAIFFIDTWKSSAAVVDGTSNTLFASEIVAAASIDAPYTTAVKGGLAANTNPTTNVKMWPSTGEPRVMNPGACLGQVDPANPTQLLSTVRSLRGRRAFEGTPVATGFNTILPPNSPSCVNANSGATTQVFGLYSASSNHSGGANCVMADGSVRFVSETINCGNLGEPAYQAKYFGAKSPFGVWGAMGSTNGGETVSL